MTTPILQLPEVTSAQIDKFTTINLQERLAEAFSIRIIEIRTSAPPGGAPIDSPTYIVGAGSISGAWASYALNDLASFVAGAWYKVTPIEGFKVWNNATNKLMIFTGSAWAALPELSLGVSAFTNGSIPYVSSGILAQENANLSYDETLNIFKALRVAFTPTSLAVTTTLGATHGRNINASGTITLTLPAAATSAGVEYLITKTDSSATTVTIDANGAELINGQANTTLVAQYSTAYLICNGTGWNLFSSGGTAISITDNVASAFSVAEGSNNYLNIVTTNTAEEIQFGNITTNPDHIFLGSGNLSIGTGTIGNTKLQVAGAISGGVNTTLTSGTTITAATANKYYRCDDTSASFTVTLPAASLSTGLELTFTKINSTVANQVTIDGSGAETIDGNASLKLSTLNSTLTIWCDGTAWRIKDYFDAGYFTPGFAGSTTPGSHTISTALGSYTRIKNQVWYTIVLTVSSKDAAMAGNVLVTGLPFVYGFDTANIANCGVSSYRQINLTASMTQVGGTLALGTANITLRESGDNINFANVDSANVNSGFNISLSGFYFV